MKLESQYWQIQNNHFIYPSYLEIIKSNKGLEIHSQVEKIINGPQVFLRGSLLEYENPFHEADIDLFVVYDNHNQLQQLYEKLQENVHYDIKLIKRDSIENNYVFKSLINCRSKQISGVLFERELIKADKKFAWEHWIQYCPSAIPNKINTTDPLAIIHFKLLTRCFGVISYLKSSDFTRDISECIRIAAKEESISAELLCSIRFDLENKIEKSYNVSNIKRLLINKFDDYFNIM
jgi:predicted nucleotidyltransferase